MKKKLYKNRVVGNLLRSFIKAVVEYAAVIGCTQDEAFDILTEAYVRGKVK